MPVKPLILQRPYTDDEARANLRSYIAREDRGSPPIFVGREAIIQKIANEVSDCRSNTGETTCFTTVIYGAPGSGKTSLLTELKERLDGGIEDGKRVDVSVVAATISGHQLSSSEIVANALIGAYNGHQLDASDDETSRRLRDQVQDSGSVWPTVIANTDMNIEDTVFLLLIDETQRIKGDIYNNPCGENSVVCDVHDGFFSTNGIKIVPVFVGLPDTVSVLNDRGLTRLKGHAIRLGEFTEDETKDLVDRWMRHPEFGFEGLFSDSDISRVSKMIMVASEGWPRHVNSYLRELGHSLLEHSSRNDMTIDLDEAFERGHSGSMCE